MFISLISRCSLKPDPYWLAGYSISPNSHLIRQLTPQFLASASRLRKQISLRDPFKIRQTEGRHEITFTASRNPSYDCVTAARERDNPAGLDGCEIYLRALRKRRSYDSFSSGPGLKHECAHLYQSGDQE